MKPEELRIGNYIEYNDIIYFIQDISMFKGQYTSNLFLSSFDSFATHYNIPIFDLKPIPLTDNWFIKFGFDILPVMNKFYFKIKYKEVIFGCNNFEMWRHQSENTYNCNGGANTEIKYVHQLQTLYYSLTGKELVNETIKA